MTALKVSNNDVVTGFDELSNWERCTPSYSGFQACLSARAEGKSVFLTITIKTPVGNYSKTFEFSNNVCFEWYPIPVAGVKICIRNFKFSETEICFSLSGELCAKIPFIGEKCVGLEYEVCIPTILMEAQVILSQDDADPRDIALALAMANLASGQDQAGSGCSCN